MNLPVRRLAFAIATSTSVAVTGCGIGNLAAPDPVTASTSAGVIQGRAMGGQQPIAGMALYVLVANQTDTATGYGALSYQLKNGGTAAPFAAGSPNAITDANGNFTFNFTNGVSNSSGTPTYTCASGGANQQVYLYGVGGNSGSGTNNAITEMAVLGPCANLSSTTFITMNEATTVAAAYALSGFATDPTHIADDEAVANNTTAFQAQRGLVNAFANAANLVNVNVGQAPATTGTVSVTGLNGSIIVPQAAIYTIANILAACVNGSPSSGNCTTLFNNATTSGTAGTGTVPTDTATAAINIAHHPASNVTTLYGLSSSTPPFSGATSQPNDFTLSLLYPQGGTGTVGIAVDSFGTAYAGYGGGPAIYKITPASGVIATGGTSPTASLTTTGTYQTALTSNLTAPQKIAIDVNNNVWIPNNGNSVSTVTEWVAGTGTGTTFSAVNTSGAPQTNLTCAALDQNDYLWLTSAGTGTPILKANLLPYPVNASATQATVTVSTGYGVTKCGVSPTTGNFAVATTGGTSSGTTYPAELYIFTDTGAPVGTTFLNGGTAGEGNGLATPTGVISDASGNFWVGNFPGSYSSTNATVSVFNGSTDLAFNDYTISPPTLPGAGGAETTSGLTSGEFDGAGNYYTGGNTYAYGTTSGIVGTIYELNASGTQVAAFYPPSGSNQYFAVDPSGNLWFGGNKTIGEMIGVAAPKVTPQVVANFPTLPAYLAGTGPAVTPGASNKVATKP